MGVIRLFADAASDLFRRRRTGSHFTYSWPPGPRVRPRWTPSSRLSLPLAKPFMTGTLLLRGMLVGLVAGPFLFAFARWTGEAQVEKAIASATRVAPANGETP